MWCELRGRFAVYPSDLEVGAVWVALLPGTGLLRTRAVRPLSREPASTKPFARAGHLDRLQKYLGKSFPELCHIDYGPFRTEVVLTAAQIDADT